MIFRRSLAILVLSVAAVGCGSAPRTSGYGTATEVYIKVPVREKLDMSDYRKVLLGRFLTSENEGFELEQELFQYLNNELRGRTDFEIIEPPEEALPDAEAGSEDVDGVFSKRQEFWTELAEGAGADLIISGFMNFHSEDRSGFVRQDYGPQTTDYLRGTTYTRFREATGFVMDFNVYLIDGKSGDVVYKDRYVEEVTFAGSTVRDIYGLYEMLDRILPRFLGILTPQKVIQGRFLLN